MDKTQNPYIEHAADHAVSSTLGRDRASVYAQLAIAWELAELRKTRTALVTVTGNR